MHPIIKSKELPVRKIAPLTAFKVENLGELYSTVKCSFGEGIIFTDSKGNKCLSFACKSQHEPVIVPEGCYIVYDDGVCTVYTKQQFWKLFKVARRKIRKSNLPGIHE